MLQERDESWTEYDEPLAARIFPRQGTQKGRTLMVLPDRP